MPADDSGGQHPAVHRVTDPHSGAHHLPDRPPLTCSPVPATLSMSPALPRGQPGGSDRTPSDGSGGPVGSPAWTWSPVRSHRLSVHGRSARPSGRAAHRPAMSSPTPGSGRTSPDGPTPAPLWQRRRTSPNPSWMTSTPSSTRSSARSLDPSTGPGSRELRPRSAARRSTSGSRRLSPLLCVATLQMGHPRLPSSHAEKGRGVTCPRRSFRAGWPL